MDITYIGHSSFKIKGKSASIVTDPFSQEMVGLKFPKHVEADIVTVSHEHEDHNCLDYIEGAPFVVRGPGEYEVKGVGIIGVPSYHDNEKGAKRGRNTLYRIDIDGVSIVHAGDLGHTLSSSDVDALNGVDILLLPVGGVYTIDAKAAVEVVSEIEPAIVIPMHYARTGIDTKVFGALTSVSAFLKEIGQEGVKPQQKLTITKDKVPEEMHVVVLES